MKHKKKSIIKLWIMKIPLKQLNILDFYVFVFYFFYDFKRNAISFKQNKFQTR